MFSINLQRYREQLNLEVEPNKRLFSELSPPISLELRFILSMSLAKDIEDCKFQNPPTNEKVFIVDNMGEIKNVLGGIRDRTVPWEIFLEDVVAPTHFIFIFRSPPTTTPSNHFDDLKKSLEKEASINTNLSFSILYHE